MNSILRAIDALNRWTVSISSWFVAALIVVSLYEVISRYVFNAPTQWAFGSLRMLGSAIIVMGWAYAQLLNSHIRVDVLYTRLSPRKRALVDVIGTGLFFFPLFGAFIGLAGSSIWHSLSYHEVLLLPLLHKMIIVLGLCLFSLQTGARFTRNVYLLTRGRAL